MKTILICPGERREVPALGETTPLSNVLLCGKALLEYWMEHLAAQGTREILVLATDRPGEVRALLGDGRRWGLRVQVIPETRELARHEAIHKYLSNPSALLATELAITVDHFPGRPDLPLFESYAGFFAAVTELLPDATKGQRIGLREIQPGVWAGLRARIAPGAQLNAPCWIGEAAEIGASAIIGPRAIIENRCIVEGGAEIRDSLVGPDTFIGQSACVQESIAWGRTLIQWRLNLWTDIADQFLVCSLAKTPGAGCPLGSRFTAALALALTLPLALFPIFRSLLRGIPVLKARRGVRPQLHGPLEIRERDIFIYYELTGIRSWLKRWPQLWSIVRGDLAWIGNRPLAPGEVAMLANDFERLWLTTQPGLLSLADVKQTRHPLDDTARAHSSYYSARASRLLDLSIFIRALFLFAFGLSPTRLKEWLDTVATAAHWKQQKEIYTWILKRMAGS